MNLIHAVDTGDSQFVERALLDLIDNPKPNFAGLSYSNGMLRIDPTL